MFCPGGWCTEKGPQDAGMMWRSAAQGRPRGHPQLPLEANSKKGATGIGREGGQPPDCEKFCQVALFCDTQGSFAKQPWAGEVLKANIYALWTGQTIGTPKLRGPFSNYDTLGCSPWCPLQYL